MNMYCKIKIWFLAISKTLAFSTLMKPSVEDLKTNLYKSGYSELEVKEMIDWYKMTHHS